MSDGTRRLVAIVVLSAKRGINNVRMLLLPLIGLVVAVSLVTSIPLYAHGTLERLLHQKLFPSENRPIGAVWLRHVEQVSSHATPAEYTALNDYLSRNFAGLVSIPELRYVQYVAGDSYVFWPANNTGFVPTNQRHYGVVAWQSDLVKHVKIVQGQAFTDAPTPAGRDIPVLMNAATAANEGLAVGDRIIYSDADKYNPNGAFLHVVGIWQPIDANDPYWLYDPDLFSTTLFVNQADLFGRVFRQLPNAPHEYSWYGVFDANQIHSVTVREVLSGLDELTFRATQLMPGTTINSQLPSALSDFEDTAALLNVLLVILSIPTIVVSLYYVSSTIGLTIDRQRNEIALLKSRGAATLQIVGMYLIQGLLLGGVALIVGPLVGMAIAELMGDSYGFLLFAQRPPIPIWLDPETVRYALGAVALSVLAALLPAIGAARHSIVTYKQEIARTRLTPLWQRYFVDVLLLAMAGYGYRSLTQTQSVISFAPVSFTQNQATLFIDPLTILVPSLAIFGAALFFVRIFPLLSAGVSLIAGLVAGAPIVLALRQIARTPRQFSSLVLLLTMTLALGTFSASAARTIDRNFSEKVYYGEPADLAVTEKWDFDPDTQVYHEPPLTAHEVPGVVAWSPWNSYTVVPARDSTRTKDQLLAIDRLTFPAVGWWRSDFADEPLGGLMNALGISPDAVLVDQAFLTKFQFHVGDIVTLNFQDTPVDFYIAGTIKEFPTLYPDQSFIFVANLSYINDQIGLAPYKSWYKLDSNVGAGTVVDELKKNGLVPIDIQNSRSDVNLGRTDPQRTGLFGTLSIGFVVAALLTVLGFFLYSFLSFERRLLQMGILRAMGLTVRELFGLLMFEQIYLILLGVAVGTGLGVYAGDLFIPFFQISTGFQNAIPPFVVTTAWPDIFRIYILLGVMLVFGLVGTATLIRRMKLYRTVKLGEET